MKVETSKQLVAEHTTALSSGFRARSTVRTAMGEPQPAHILWPPDRRSSFIRFSFRLYAMTVFPPYSRTSR